MRRGTKISSIFKYTQELLRSEFSDHEMTSYYNFRCIITSAKVIILDLDTMPPTMI